MPMKLSEVDVSANFEDNELLYRRVAEAGVNLAGELLPSSINTISFDKSEESAPSVLRSKFAVPQDALSVDCADGKDVSTWRVYQIEVIALPKGMRSGDGRQFDCVPKHKPLVDCGAHSVISSVLNNDEHLTYIRPPRAVLNDIRAKLATGMRPVP